VFPVGKCDKLRDRVSRILRKDGQCTTTKAYRRAASPLSGATFIDLTDLYSKRIREIVKKEDSSLAEGVYVHWRGPTYETPAEILMMRTMGADLVGMSTVPEAIAAHALGAEVLGISLVTNAAAGVTGEKLNHEEVIAAGKAAASRMGSLLATTIPKLV